MKQKVIDYLYLNGLTKRKAQECVLMMWSKFGKIPEMGNLKMHLKPYSKSGQMLNKWVDSLISMKDSDEKTI